MATINASTFRQGVSIAPSVAALPYIEIDESSLRLTSRTIQGYGVIYEDGTEYEGQFTYYGRFNGSSESALLKSTVTGANIASPELGGFSIHGLNLKISDFMGDPSAAARKMLKGHDMITGTSFNDDLDGYLGNDKIVSGLGDDIVRGGTGKDVIDAGTGMDVVYGGVGRDRFVIGSGDGYVTIKDYERGQDAVDFSRINNVTTEVINGDLWFYSGSDALAVLVGTSSL